MALTFAVTALLAGEVFQRLVVAPWVKLRPSARIPVLGGWMKIMAWAVTRPPSWIAGCKMPQPPRVVPTGPGILVLMNHQSLYDIPLVIQTIADGYPRIVTRERYAARWIPVISHMIKLYQYPVVDPSANRDEMRKSLEALGEAARTADVPLVVFPEGTRTKDGEIAPFKRGGLGRILAARTWTVYVMVADGFWTAARLEGFAANLPYIDGRIEHVATLEWSDTSADGNAFLDDVRDLMVQKLSEMRGSARVA